MINDVIRHFEEHTYLETLKFGVAQSSALQRKVLSAKKLSSEQLSSTIVAKNDAGETVYEVSKADWNSLAVSKSISKGIINAFIDVFEWKPQYGEMANVAFSDCLADRSRLGETMNILRKKLFRMGKPDKRNFVMVPLHEKDHWFLARIDLVNKKLWIADWRPGKALK